MLGGVHSHKPDAECGPKSGVSKIEKGRGAVGRRLYFSQLAFAHHALVRLVAAPDFIFELAIALRQSSGDDVGAPRRRVVATGDAEENDLADLKFVGRHGAPPRAKPSAVIVHHRSTWDKEEGVGKAVRPRGRGLVR